MLRFLGKAVRARPKTIFFILFLLGLLACGGGFYGYALHQWRLAQKAVKEDRAADARNAIKLCLVVWPRSVPVHLLAARVERMTGHPEEADILLKECTRLEHGVATADIQLEYLLMRVQSGDEDGAAPDLENYLKAKHPDTPLILKTLSLAYLHRLRYAHAIMYLDRWIQADPDAAIAYYLQGWAYENVNGHTKAMENYQKAIALRPDLFEARLKVAEMLLYEHNPDEALPHLERLRKQDPDRPEVLARLGQCRFLQGDMQEAQRLLESALVKLPDDATLLVHLAKIDLAAGRPVEAEKWLRRALKADPFDSEALYTLPQSLRAQNRLEEAEIADKDSEDRKKQLVRINYLLSDEVNMYPADPRPPYEAGAFLLQIGRDREGEFWLYQALKRDNGYVPAHKALAEYYEKTGDKKLAAEHRSRLPQPEKNTTTP
jgi:tetratricopeptide (TPR) repeat protein